MRFVVIGPGALGCLLAASLDATGQQTVWLLDHDHHRAALLNRQGLRLTTPAGVRHCPVRATDDGAAIGTVDCLLLCVKSHQVEAALTLAAPLLATAPLIIGFQNGIGHLDTMAARLSPGKWGLGVTSSGATLLAPGHVRPGGTGFTRIGFLHPPTPEAEALLRKTAAALTASGIDTTVAADITTHIWSKLLVNAGINALTAILDCPNGGLLASPTARQRLTAAVLEGARIASALGIPLRQEPLATTLEVCRATSANLSSMLQDVRQERRTEIDAINGALVREGERLGIPVPENRALVREIKARERGFSDDSS